METNYLFFDLQFFHQNIHLEKKQVTTTLFKQQRSGHF